MEHKTIEYKQSWQDKLPSEASLDDLDDETIDRFVVLAENRLPLVKGQKNKKLLLQKLQLFTKDIYTEKNLKKMGLNERQIKAVLYVKEKGRISNQEYQKLNNCSRNTATNDLRELIEKNIIKTSGKKGQGAYYVFAQ